MRGHELPRHRPFARARQDFDEIVAWIFERSPQGADRWVTRFEEALARLEENPFVAPIAAESEELREEVRHILFRTRAGRTYRALFLVAGEEVRILRIRGAGQKPSRPEDIET
ncbi:MAG: type II toxin-antitoxin system RelE/ParE family toxin [Isosphaerales bacterium]